MYCLYCPKASAPVSDNLVRRVSSEGEGETCCVLLRREKTVERALRTFFLRPHSPVGNWSARAHSLIPKPVQVIFVHVRLLAPTAASVLHCSCTATRGIRSLLSACEERSGVGSALPSSASSAASLFDVHGERRGSGCGKAMPKGACRADFASAHFSSARSVASSNPSKGSSSSVGQ